MRNRPISRVQKISVAITFCFLPLQSIVAWQYSPITPTESSVSVKGRPNDVPTRKAFESFYNSDYDSAIQGFQAAQEAHPDDPFAANHLLEAVLVREIDREGALNAELYLRSEFLHTKKALVDEQVRNRIEDLAKQALYLSTERLKEKPDDTDALYARGVTRSLYALYEGFVEKAWYSAFRNALGAYDDHKRVLELTPSYSDANLVVGVYEYIVAGLPVYERVVAFMLSIKGSKAEGMGAIRQAADAGGGASVDAKTALSLFLARERLYPEALSLMSELYRSYPHNFHFGFSQAGLFRSSGNIPEAVTAYRNLLDLGQRQIFPHPRLTRAAYALGETLRFQGDYRAAADAYESVAKLPGADREQVAKTKLLAGEMYDLLQERDAAIRKYHEAITLSSDSTEIREAKRLLNHPYHNP